MHCFIANCTTFGCDCVHITSGRSAQKFVQLFNLFLLLQFVDCHQHLEAVRYQHHIYPFTAAVDYLFQPVTHASIVPIDDLFQ